MPARRRLRLLVPVALAAVAAGTTGAVATTQRPAPSVHLREDRIAQPAMDALRADFVHQILANNKPGTWAPMKMTLGNRDLRLMGLPSKHFLLTHRFSRPTLVTQDGTATPVALPTAATFAGTGWFGIRPGAWLLTVTDNEIGWCSMAHVYGAPGTYAISTAGHCGKTGDIGTVIGLIGDHSAGVGTPVPVLLDFGKYCHSTGDAGIGKDWALICIDPE